jgi:hypothetical protein
MGNHCVAHTGNQSANAQSIGSFSRFKEHGGTLAKVISDRHEATSTIMILLFRRFN